MDWHMWGMEEAKRWNRALNIAAIRSLQGLRQVRLRIHYILTSEDENMKNCINVFNCPSSFEDLKKLAILPLSSIEIAVKNLPDIAVFRSKAERTEYAEGLHNLLLDPEGAEI
ncbi:hypothetical protein IMSHALPRED_003758 [Imshaugia aleurites]|uniref:Uncharacterized protein n=1 Tax=Imshaugia aleurites TaxID=172621 RepID=A0A8H3FBN0_9LECA|nr:hypothetical protein IMSHALPRED_003758 [Imshaugia aleurites]